MTNSIQPIKEGRIVFETHTWKSTRLHPWLLTATEWQVVAAVCAGCETRTGLAQQFNVANRTIDTHIYRIFRKLAIYSLAELILKVLHDPAARERCFPHLQIVEKP